jgi:FkbM family methyltransferase
MMGWVREKYTKPYFTGFNDDGSCAGYGVLGFSDTGTSVLREFDVKILQKISLQGRHILEFGFGRGEAIRYTIERGIASYIGVDFAPVAVELATDYLERNGIQPPPLHCADALEFLRSARGTLPHAIDVVIMFDFIEHVPRRELRELFALLRPHLSETPVIAINTPVYAFDNDVVSDGIDLRNHVNAIDRSDFIEETQGMHCNKFTVISLQEFMSSAGYTALSEYHVFVPTAPELIRSEIVHPIPAYSQAWTAAHRAGFPIEPTYLDDDLEYAYAIDEKPSWNLYTSGLLQGIEVLLTRRYFELLGSGGSLPLFAEEISAGKTVFDVGAFVGLHSLLFAKLVGGTGRVISFEPNPWNVGRLRLNLSHNAALAERISLYPLGLGIQSGKSVMIMSDSLDNGYSSTSQLRCGGRTAIPHQELYEMGFQDVTVTMDTLDEFVERTGVIPDLIKIDIEGAEVDFLRGGLRTLQKYKPSLFIEAHNPMAIFFAIEILRSLDYNLEALEEERDNRLQILAKPLKNHSENGGKLVLQETLYLLFDQNRRILRRSNEMEFLQKRIFELSTQIINLKSQFPAMIKDELAAITRSEPVVPASLVAELFAQTANMKSELLAAIKDQVLTTANGERLLVSMAADLSTQIANLKSELLTAIKKRRLVF